MNDTPVPDSVVSAWLSRIRTATDYHRAWWQQFRCSTTSRYYEGRQWEGMETYFRPGYSPYVVNMFFSTIEVKLPTYLFEEPIFNVKPKPFVTDPAAGFDPMLESKKARLRECALNTWVQEEENHFADEIEYAILDAFFAIGLIEVEKSSDYVMNPKAGQPYLRDDGTEITDSEDQVVRQPETITEWEQVYVKRIHPAQFRVGGYDQFYLDRCNWYGYWEYMPVLEVRDNKRYNSEARKQITFAGAKAEEFLGSEFKSYDLRVSDEMTRLLQTGDVVKIWKIWDNTRHERYIFSESNTDKYLYKAPFTTPSIYPLRFSKRSRGFWPIPPASQWISPQDEINEANEQLRAHRRRSSRKYLVKKGVVDSEEMDKLMFGPDGTYAETEGDPATTAAALPMNPVDSSVTDSMITGKDNFNVVSGTASEMRGQADRTTATQAGIINQRQQIRDARPKIVIAKWLNRIARHILWLQGQLELPFWIQLNQQTNTQGINEAGLPGSLGMLADQTAAQFEQITGSEISGLDFEVEINVSSMSPIDNQDELNKLLSFLAIIGQYQMIALSPILIQEVADKVGLSTSQQVIAELQRMAVMQQMALQMQAPQADSPLGQRTVAKETPPQMEQTRNQVAKQAGMPQ